MRIGIIAPPWLPVPPPAYGGVEAFVDTLARELHARGHDVVLAASGDSTCPVPRLPGFPPSSPAAMGMTTNELPHLIRSYARMSDADIVVDNTLAGPVVATAAAAAPVVTVVHGELIDQAEEIYGAASPSMTFVAISRHQASTSRRLRFARVIHHGMRVDEVPRGAGGDAACFVGRMHPAKGVLPAIRIAERAGVRLRIAAKMMEPIEQDYFREVVRPALGRHAEYVGELSVSEKYELMGSSCALLNPLQWNEPFGLVMIEALATGTPVLATPRGSVPEIVDDGRTGFIRSDPAGLADALRLAHSLARHRCRATAEQRFSARRMADDYLALFDEVIEAGRMPRSDVRPPASLDLAREATRTAPGVSDTPASA